MTRIALVAGPDPGHALNAIELGRELVSRGVEVTVATGRRHEPAIVDSGARFVELPLLSPTAGDDDLGHLLVHRPSEMAPPLADELRPWNPDVVVADVITVAGAFAAELLGVPWIELSPHVLYDQDPLVPPVGMGRQPARRPWRVIGDERIRRAQARSQADGRALRNRARAELGLAGDGEPVLRMAATLPALELPRSRWPEDAFVVGPLDADPPGATAPIPEGSGPLVVVTDSTASGVTGSLAGAAVEGLRHAGVRLVATTSRTDLESWPTGCHIGRAPHGPLLDEAAVAIGPGGAGFLGKALGRGVPMVVVPLAGDQRENAGRVRWAGAGVKLRPSLCTPTLIRLATERVLADPRFTQGAGRAAATAEGLGVRVAATLVQEVAAGRRPRATHAMSAHDFV